MATIGSSTEPSVPESAAAVAHRQRSGSASCAADEPQAIRLVGHLADVGTVHRHQVQHPGRLLAEGAGPARAQDRAPLPQDFGLHEKIAEGRMQRVRGRRCDHHFGVARDVDFPALSRSIGDADPAQLDIILRRYDDLGMRLEIAIAGANESRRRNSARPSEKIAS